MASHNEVTTLHLSNLPADFTERELFLLFGSMKGFKNGMLKFTPGKMMGFVTFDTREFAAEAIERVNGLSWTGSSPEFTIRVSFAATQTRSVKSDRSILSNHSGTKGAAVPFYPQPHTHQPATLFVSGICESLSDLELSAIFDRTRPIRISRQGAKAWVCYTTTEEAVAAINMVSGFTTPSQPVPLKVFFARTEMRER